MAALPRVLRAEAQSWRGLAAKPEKSVRACSLLLHLNASGAIPPNLGICYSADA